MPDKDQQGTGKHPHKSTEEPYPHRERGSGNEERSARESNESGGESQGGGESSGQDLKEREYRDKQGDVHHHTHTYEEQHK
jgi:hypothetical protein